MEGKRINQQGVNLKRPACCQIATQKVVYLPRHMQNVHQWSKDSVCTATACFILRKKYTFINAEMASAGNRKRKMRSVQRRHALEREVAHSNVAKQ